MIFKVTSLHQYLGVTFNDIFGLHDFWTLCSNKISKKVWGYSFEIGPFINILKAQFTQNSLKCLFLVAPGTMQTRLIMMISQPNYIEVLLLQLLLLTLLLLSFLLLLLLQLMLLLQPYLLLLIISYLVVVNKC